MKKFLMTITDEMFDVLQDERKKKGQLSLQETVREIIADYFRKIE